jgi:hypothetical protein
VSTKYGSSVLVIKRVVRCESYPDQKECTVTINLGIPENDDYHCESSVPDFCVKPFERPGYMFNGTWNSGNELSCRDVKPLSDFRVTIEDQARHHFDRNYDDIGSSSNEFNSAWSLSYSYLILGRCPFAILRSSVPSLL